MAPPSWPRRRGPNLVPVIPVILRPRPRLGSQGLGMFVSHARKATSPTDAATDAHTTRPTRPVILQNHLLKQSSAYSDFLQNQMKAQKEAKLADVRGYHRQPAIPPS